MFILGKLFTYLILPPGGLVLIALCSGFFAYVKRARVAAWLAWATALLLYLLSIQPVADLLLSPLESAAVSAETTVEDSGPRPRSAGDETSAAPAYIVVAGGGAIRARFAPEMERPAARILSGPSLSRHVEAFRLFRTNGATIVVSAGSVFSQDEAEAVTAARFLESLGVPEEDIIVEPQSRSTWENATKVREMIADDEIYLVTSAYHMRRTLECFRANGFQPVPVSADYRVQSPPYTFWDFLPDASSLDNSAAALKEQVGRIFYRIRYGSAGYRFGV